MQKHKPKCAEPEPPPPEKTNIYQPGSLRFCRTCGAKQVFKVKGELVNIFSGKNELSKKSCALCGNAIAPPKKVKASSPSSETEHTSGVSKPGTSGQKRPSDTDTTQMTTAKSPKKIKLSTTASDLRESVDGGGDADEEKQTDEGAATKNDKTDSGDQGEGKCEVDESKDVKTTSGGCSDDEPDADNSADPDNTLDLDNTPDPDKAPVSADDDIPSDSTKENVEEQPLYPTNRRPGRPRKSVKEKKNKGPRRPSNAPPPSNLAELCEAEDDGTMFVDGRRKENRLQFALQGLDPVVGEMMDKEAKEEAPFKCKQCKNVEFTHVKAFLKHMSKHTGEKPMSHPYKCDSCSKRFVQSRVLQLHLVSHADDRPYKCKFCDAAFKIRSGLWRHSKIHTAPKQHLCNICGQRFQEKRKLQNHEMIHSGELPYKCQHCGEGFRRIESMRRHEKAHTGERPHVCEFCGRSFKERGDIRKHLLLHSGEKPYQCQLCSYRSNRKEYVKLHMKTHSSGSALHKCTHCDLTFSSSVVCKKHEKEHFEPIQKEEVVETVQELKIQEEVMPTTLIINQGEHPHQEMLSAVDFLLQFDSANRVFATPTTNQDGTVTYVTQTQGTAESDQEGATVTYVTQSELTGNSQEGMVKYVTQHAASASGEETVAYVTEAQPSGDSPAQTMVAYITEAPSTDGKDQEATVTYVTQSQ